MYEAALGVLKKLNQRGFEAYIVGGFPRDRYLNIKSDDIDICTSAKPEEIQEMFVVKKQFSFYGVSVITEQDFDFEVTTFRQEANYKGHRYPQEIKFVDTLKEDLMRRDFIINTLCIDKNGKNYDLFHAQEDLDKRIIRTVGDADQKIKEDALRIIRALKFSVKLHFKIEQSLQQAIIKNKELLKEISVERIRKELNDIDEQRMKEKLNEFYIEFDNY